MKTYIVVKKEDAKGGKYYSEDEECFTDDIKDCTGYYEYELASDIADNVNGYAREATEQEIEIMEEE